MMVLVVSSVPPVEEQQDELWGGLTVAERAVQSETVDQQVDRVRRRMMTDPEPRDPFMQAAIDEAKEGLAEGGIPIGSVLVIGGTVVGRGHNRRVQRDSAVPHAETDAIEDAGRLKTSDYRRAVLYSTLSPCDMCSGTALLYKIPRVVIGENRTFRGPEEYLRSRGVVLEVLNDPECVRLMEEFIRARPDLWNEDIGV
jgi:creatinine deaminase